MKLLEMFELNVHTKTKMVKSLQKKKDIKNKASTFMYQFHVKFPNDTLHLYRKVSFS